MKRVTVLLYVFVGIVVCGGVCAFFLLRGESFPRTVSEFSSLLYKKTAFLRRSDTLEKPEGVSDEVVMIITGLGEELRVNHIQVDGPVTLPIRVNSQDPTLERRGYGYYKHTYIDNTSVDNMFDVIHNRFSELGFEKLSYDTVSQGVSVYTQYMRDTIVCVYEKREGDTATKLVLSFGCFDR